VVGNFGKSSATYTFPAESTWYDYFEGGVISGTITLSQGEFRLATDFQ
jgi:alpha-glucosidase (family GH31 glycosyl hydrolase)